MNRVESEGEPYNKKWDVSEGGKRDLDKGGTVSFAALDSSEKNDGYTRREIATTDGDTGQG